MDLDPVSDVRISNSPNGAPDVVHIGSLLWDEFYLNLVQGNMLWASMACKVDTGDFLPRAREFVWQAPVDALDLDDDIHGAHMHVRFNYSNPYFNAAMEVHGFILGFAHEHSTGIAIKFASPDLVLPHVTILEDYVLIRGTETPVDNC